MRSPQIGRPSLEAVRRFSQRAARARPFPLNAKIYRTPCVTSSSPCSQPTVSIGQQAPPRSLSCLKLSAPPALTSTGFS